MVRNHLGVDFTGFNTSREGVPVPPMAAGQVHTADFHIEFPELYPGTFSFSPAIADGTLNAYTVCDWIDNAMVLQMGHGQGEIYGFMRFPCRVELDARLGKAAGAAARERRVG